MFYDVKDQLTQLIDRFCNSRGLPVGKVEFRSIPFSGEWGIAAPLFPLAAADPDTPLPVPKKAQALAEVLKDQVADLPGFSRVEAVRGYLNLYFEPRQYAERVVSAVLKAGEAFGTREKQGKQVMVEYSNPNTHKPLHVGHLRNVILGGSVCNILEASGKKVIRANYIGDIGLHVIK